MLQNRALISVFRQRSLQAYAGQIPTRLGARSQPLVHHIRPQQRPISSARPISRPTPSLNSCCVSPFRRIRNVRRSSDKPSPSEQASEEAQSLSARFKALSRKYGWSAVGVYFGLSVLDFPFCFLAVRLVGPERIGEVEHAIVDSFWSLVGVAVPSMKPENRVAVEATDAEILESTVVNGNGHKKDNASIWTQLLLAYGVHKSLIFFRIPLTAAVTPKVVKTLRGWGWNIGKPKARSTG